MKTYDEYGPVVYLQDTDNSHEYESVKQMFDELWGMCENTSERWRLLDAVYYLIEEFNLSDTVEVDTLKELVEKYLSPKINPIKLWKDEGEADDKEFDKELEDAYNYLYGEFSAIGPPWSFFDYVVHELAYCYVLDETALMEDDEVFKATKEGLDEKVLWEAVSEGCKYIYYCSDHGNPNLVRITLDTEALY